MRTWSINYRMCFQSSNSSEFSDKFAAVNQFTASYFCFAGMKTIPRNRRQAALTACGLLIRYCDSSCEMFFVHGLTVSDGRQCLCQCGPLKYSQQHRRYHARGYACQLEGVHYAIPTCTKRRRYSQLWFHQENTQFICTVCSLFLYLVIVLTHPTVPWTFSTVTYRSRTRL